MTPPIDPQRDPVGAAEAELLAATTRADRLRDSMRSGTRAVSAEDMLRATLEVERAEFQVEAAQAKVETPEFQSAMRRLDARDARIEQRREAARAQARAELQRTIDDGSIYDYLLDHRRTTGSWPTYSPDADEMLRAAGVYDHVERLIANQGHVR